MRSAFPIALIAVAAASAAVLAADSPSFDCAKASGEIETLICSDADLAALDRKLAETYGAAVTVAEKGDAETLKTLKATQIGWIKGRNDCWKAEDKRACTQESYETRIAELQARFALIPARGPFTFQCDDAPGSEIVATFYNGERSSVRLERGDRTVIAVQGMSGSGARYLGPNGIVFWNKGNDAQVTWPEGTEFKCATKG